jgi:aminopeptidase N
MLRSTGGRGRDVLYRAEAVERSARVHEPTYTLSFDLAEDGPTYTGRSTIEFDLRAPEAGLFLDFRGHPLALRVNGARLEPEHREQRIWLPGASLATHNRVEVDFENEYDVTGDGFHRFVDPEDGEMYLYTNFEPFGAHRLFPCFDQPDLKASYRLSVTAPAAWTVVSAEAPGAVEARTDGRREHRFPATPRFSTYLFPLIAGPFERLGERRAGVDLGILGRRSMRRELERSAEEILEVTAQGMTYYAELFGRPYPFGKYDQLFVPEFNAGAMENVGAVTFADAYLFRDPPTYAQRLARGEVVLHELAHMWFGDLVTMRWWDDLWLNETFATYLSYRCLASATRFADAWQVFNGEMRPAAHRQDQLSTTHPVATRVEHTDQAVGNFDAITYEKGAAVIKQLVAAIGDDAFRDGLRTYFDRHAWGNASLEDFLGALADASGRPLDDWARLWLQSASLNTISVRWSCDDQRVTHLEVRQSAPAEHPTLRPHATILALVSAPSPGGELAVESIPVHVEGDRLDVPSAVGRPAPLFIYPDHGDHDFALVDLDPVSLAFALQRLPDLPEPLLRQQVWSTLFELVRGAALPATEYLAAVRRFAPLEDDRALVASLLDRAADVLRRFLPEDRALIESRLLLGTCLETLRATSGDLRLSWARTAVAVAADRDGIGELLGLADDGWAQDGFEVDQEMRWALAVKAQAHDLPDAERRASAELRRDPSDRGQRAFIRAQVSRPDGQAKREAWERIDGDGYGSDYLTRAAISGFQWVHQRELLLPFREPFYARLEQVYATRDHAFAGSYARGLVPDRWAEPAELERLRAFRAGLPSEQVLLGRHLDEIADDLGRDIRVRAVVALARPG